MPRLIQSRAAKRELTHRGVTKTAEEWASQAGIPVRSFLGRIAKGRSFESALEPEPTPTRFGRDHHEAIAMRKRMREGVSQEEARARVMRVLQSGWSIWQHARDVFFLAAITRDATIQVLDQLEAEGLVDVDDDFRLGVRYRLKSTRRTA